MWLRPREREGGERWIEKEARVWEGRRAREGGEQSCEWRRKGSADDETGTCRSAGTLHVFRRRHDVRMHEADWGGSFGGGGRTWCTSVEEESHSKHSQMIKGFWDNLQHLTFRLREKINNLSLPELLLPKAQ